MRPNTRAVFFETPTNPVLELVDIEAVAKIAHAPARSWWWTMCSPRRCCSGRCRSASTSWSIPATKHHRRPGRCLGGVVLGTKDFIEDKLHTYLKQTGPSLSPVQCPGAAQGLETLPLRVEPSLRVGGGDRRFPGRAKGGRRACYYPGRADHPQSGARQDGRWRAAVPWSPSRVKGGASGRVPPHERAQIFDRSATISAMPRASSPIPPTTTHQRLTPEVRAELGIFDRSVRLPSGLRTPDDLIGRSRPAR